MSSKNSLNNMSFFSIIHFFITFFSLGAPLIHFHLSGLDSLAPLYDEADEWRAFPKLAAAIELLFRVGEAKQESQKFWVLTHSAVQFDLYLTCKKRVKKC